MECRENSVLKHLDFIFPMYSYRLWNKELLFLWKINGQRSLSYFFAAKVSLALGKLGISFIVPVPPRKGKIAKNGWDQIDELCTLLNVFFGHKILRLLERTTKLQQKKLDRENRLNTIESAYRLLPEKVLEKNLKRMKTCLSDKICIIDDVCTTGSTLEACAKLLKEYGFSQVGALTIFTVD